jgi:hypothetical protein
MWQLPILAGLTTPADLLLIRVGYAAVDAGTLRKAISSCSRLPALLLPQLTADPCTDRIVATDSKGTVVLPSWNLAVLTPAVSSTRHSCQRMQYRGCLNVQKRPRSAGTSETQYPGQATARVLWELCVAGRLADLA